MPAYYSDTCGTGLHQKLVIPTTPNLEFYLNPDDVNYQDEDAGVSVSIKYDRFTRDVGAVVPTFTINLVGIDATVVSRITGFAESDFLNNVLTTGRGSISFWYQGDELTNLYIQPPIDKGPSYFIDGTPPIERFDNVTLKLINPAARWF
jgi:hypothetical protein